MSKLSENLTELMQEDGYNQSSIANVLKTPRAKISLYQSGKSSPNFKFFVAFLELFNCSADFLIGRSEEPQREKVYKPVPPFGAHLNKLFSESKLKKSALIESKNISWNTLHNWLTGNALPNIGSLEKLADFFDCSVDFVIGRTEY